LLPLLKDSTHGIEEFSQMAKDAGVIITESGVKKAEDWKAANEHLAASWDGVKLKAFENNDAVIQATNVFAHFLT